MRTNLRRVIVTLSLFMMLGLQTTVFAVAWEKVIAKSKQSVVVTDLLQTKDGGFLVLGSIHLTFPNVDMLLIKLDPRGNIEWQISLGAEGEQRPFTLTELKGGDYLLGGFDWRCFECNFEALLIKVKRSGQIEWQKRSEAFPVIYDIDATDDGGFIAAGQQSIRDPLLMKFDAAGNIQWQKIYRDGEKISEPQAVEQTADGGYVVTGYIVNKGDNDYWVLKVDASCNSRALCSYSPRYR